MLKGAGKIDKDVIVFAFFLVLSFIFWYLNSLGKEMESEVRYPVRYINLPEERVLTDDLPVRLSLYLKGPGYSILKLKLSGNKPPLVLDISSVNYRRVPGSNSLDYFILTSGLIPNLRNQLRAECEIRSIQPDTLFFSFDRIVTKRVPVTPEVEVLTVRQYFVKGNILVKPDSVKVTGPEHVIDTVYEIPTRYKKFSGLNDNVTKSILLKIPRNISVSEKKVLLTIPVEQFTEAEIVVPVKILNQPDTLDVKIFPDEVTVIGLVAVSDYEKFKGIPFEVILDLGRVNLKSSEKIPVEFRNIPPFVNSLRITPSKVDFLIERKLR